MNTPSRSHPLGRTRWIPTTLVHVAGKVKAKFQYPQAGKEKKAKELAISKGEVSVLRAAVAVVPV